MELGIYEQVINKLFAQKLAALSADKFHIETKEISKEEASIYLTNYISCIIGKALDILNVCEDGVERSILLMNSIINNIIKTLQNDDFKENLIDTRNRILTAIIDKTQCDFRDVSEYIKTITPETRLTRSTLFTGAKDSVNMVHELKREIESSDEICLLISFIRNSGLSLIFEKLKEFTARPQSRLKILTTTYIKATELSALKKLASLPNTDIKVSYDLNGTRLHAKAYIFLRKTGFDTAYIGSSNLSSAAIRDGLEWNVKVTNAQLPSLMKSVKNTFDAYWESDVFEPFDEEKFQLAMKDFHDYSALDYAKLDLLRAKDYQNDILKKLSVERQVHHRYRNLVVAATGTGKTVVSAYDFKRFRENYPSAKLLFVAHREEILKQSLATFRTVLNDQNFGELWYGQNEAKKYSQLFASKDLLNNRLDEMPIKEDYYDYIIIDEAHHIAAPSYQKILSKFRPRILLGLTATPERMDGLDILKYFDNHISAEIRLPDALNNNLLCPFRYYGITDSVDLSDVKWHNGGYDIVQLTEVYKNSTTRIQAILHSLEKYLPDTFRKNRALCFCVSQEHAKFMNAQFTLAGLKSAVLISENSSERDRILNLLRDRKINYLFVVDIFNEGVDVRSIDTILFLRPTESLMVFLQQLGRGLRKDEDKEFLTVLDFVGNARKEFNYAQRFRALIGRTSLSVLEELKRGFPHLPNNCYIELEEVAYNRIKENIEQQIASFSRKGIIQKIENFEENFSCEFNLANFQKVTLVPLERIYKNGTWTSLCVEAGRINNEVMKHEKELKFAVYRKWLSTDSFSYFEFIHKLVKSHFRIKVNQLPNVEQKMALMLYYDFYDTGGVFNSIQAMFDDFASDSLLVRELKELLPILLDRCESLELQDNSGIKDFPLQLHGIYSKAQIQAAIGTSTLLRKSPSREGCERNKEQNTESMFVDIIKDREEGSTTDYNDFAMNNNLFHWESQSTVTQKSATGQAYINGSQNMLLFVRQQATFPEDKYRTMGYVYLGKVMMNRYKGNKPMQIEWNMVEPMPASVYTWAKKF